MNKLNVKDYKIIIMKKLFSLFFMLLSCFVSFSQQVVQDPYSGLETELSDDKQFLVVTKILPGSPADLSTLRQGAQITNIDNLKVSDIVDITNYFFNNKSKGIKIRISNGNEIQLQRVTINLFEKGFSTELSAFYHFIKGYAPYYMIDDYSFGADKSKVKNFDEIIQSVENPKAYTYTKSYRDQYTFIGCTYRPILNPEKQSQISILADESRDIRTYKTFDFDYLSQADPLMEKTLLKKLEILLMEKGLVRNTENPQILIVINFYSGQKEQYVPPQQITSTKIYNYYNWYWGSIPVPVTQSRTKAGYTETSYLNNINLKFLDSKEIATSKVPPIIWSASYSEITMKKAFLSDIADDIFKIVLIQYPKVFNGNAENVQIHTFSYTGMLLGTKDKKGYTEVRDVIPDSPAEKSGIQKGDIIKWHNQGGWNYSYVFYGSSVRNPDLRLMKALPWNTMSYSGQIDFEVKRNGKKMLISVTPELKKIILFEDYFSIFK